MAELGEPGGSLGRRRVAAAVKILCFDIECVRDLAVWRHPSPDPDSTVVLQTHQGPAKGTIIAHQREVFPPPFAFRPVCIACVLIETDGKGGYDVRKMGVISGEQTGNPDANELQLLTDWRGTVEKLQPELVTWNGRRFDLPVLMLRSLRYGISHDYYYQERDFRYRFSEDRHLDLADAMGDYGAFREPLSLDGMSKLIGLPGKYGDLHGSDVEAAFHAGRLEEIRNYCLADAAQTAFHFLRWRYHRGSITLASYRSSASSLLEMCAADARLGPFASLVDQSTLLLDGLAAQQAATPAPEAA
jgi:3'-5' exonuclease